MAEGCDNPVNLKIKYKCHVCGKDLSRKQRLLSHLSSVHGTEEASHTRYKKYMRDPTKPIPKRTLARIRSKFIFETNLNPVQSTSLNESETMETSAEDVPGRLSDEDISDKVLPMTCSETDNQTQDMVNNDGIPCNNSVLNSQNSQPYAKDLSDSDQIVLSDYSSETDTDLCFSDSSVSYSDEEFDKDTKCDLQNTDDEKHLAILSYMLKFNLNGQASRDLVDMISALSEKSSSLREISLSKIKSSIETSEVSIRDFCDKCFSLFPVDETVYNCSQSECSGLRYKGNVEQQELKQKKSYFTCLSLSQQVLDILKRDGMWQCIQDYRKASKDANGITDITTGALYKSLCHDDNFLASKNNITLLFNTDGVPLYKSSGVSIWPLYLVVNELPPKMRFSKKNMILWGVWQSKGKPVFQTFLQPFIEEMEKIKTDGFTLVIDGEEISVRAMLLAGTMDLQAKAYITEMTQHNGHFGCLTCEHPGKVVSQGKGHARVYPPTDYPLRTTQGLIENAREASTVGQPIKGIKGVSTLLGLDWFNLIDGLGPDYMHGVLLGMTKKLLQLFFSATNSKQPFSIATCIKEVDKHLKQMKPTDAIVRLPRALENNIHHMKASELQNWLLFYSVPCLINYMDKKYFDHFVLFVEGIYLLLGDCITEEQMERAELVLCEFYYSFGQLYGENNCTLNLHNACCHLPQYVKLLGPLWSWSCFPFENMNGNILKSVHGTGDVCLQILWVSQAQKRLAIDSSLIIDQELKTFTDRMAATTRSVNVTKNASNCQIIGGTASREVSQDVKSQVQELVLHDSGKITFPSRVIVKDTIFYSNDYERHTKRICNYVLVQLNGNPCVAVVDHFIYHQDKNVCFAVIRKVTMDEQKPLVHQYVHHLLKVNSEPDIVEHVVRVEHLLEKLLYLNGNKTFSCVSRLPNLHGLCS